MSKEKGKPIPGDWDGENFSFYMLCGPDSVLWDGYIRGAIFELTRGRGWDANTGNIKATQEIAWGVYESMAKCDDFINVQRMLVAAITGQSVNLDDPLPTGVVDFSGVGLAAQLRTVDADKRLADVVEDQELSVTTNVTNQVDPAAVTVENNIDTQAIADNIAAETVAADARNVDLVTALQALKLVCNTVVKCSGCGSCGGSEPPSQPGDETSDPPIGFSEPTYEGQPSSPGTSAYNSRKCKIANLIHDRIIESYQKLNDMPYIGATIDVLTDIFGAAWLFALSSLINAYLGTVTILGVSISISGWVDELAQTLVEGGVDIDALILNLQDNREDYICALYASPGSDVAISDYLGVAEDNGMNFANIAVLGAFLAADYINTLYFNRDDIQAQLEEALDGYTEPTPCTNCASGCQSVIVDVGIITGQTSNTITVQSVPTGNLHQIAVYWNADGTPGQLAYCGSPGANVTDITSTNNLVGGIVQDNPDNTTIDNFHLYPPNSNLPTFPYTNVGRIIFTFNSGQSGTVTITFNQP